MDYTFKQVLDAFSEYINDSRYMDVCHTKFGYAVLHYDPDKDSFVYAPNIIRTPADMLQCMREEIVLDVLRGTGRDLEEATREELKKIADTTNLYMNRLYFS